MSGPGFDDPDLTALARRIFDDVAAFSPDVRGVSRPAYSAVETRTLDYLEGIAEAHQLRTWRDAGANLVIAAAGDTLPETPAGYFGSHVDSVPEGGNYDGLAGVVAGLVTLISLTREGWKPRVPLRVLALRGEESAWYGQAYMGSQALFGKLGPKALASRRRTVDDIAAGKPLIDAGAIRFFVELHIEQGPVLIDRDWPVAAVTGIRGNFRHRDIQCIGEAGHSGAVPRWLRRDAVFATAELIMRMDDHWSTIQQHGGDLVLTAGIFQTDPAHHALSRIPGETHFSFEARSQHPATLHAIEGLLHTECEGIQRDRKVKFVFDGVVRAPSAELDSGILDAILAACTAEGLPAESVPSGAGHDAAIFAEAGVPTGMIFVRNQNGSHNPDEAMELADLMAGIGVMRRLAKELTR
jgi:N-carbamoyl-L-amino-acid hydrolase